MSDQYRPRSRWGILPPKYRTSEQVHSVTTAASGHSSDLSKRQLQYGIAMTIRLVCFVLAVLVPFGWFTWVFIVGAVILPYVAVVLANAGGRTGETGLEKPLRSAPRLSEQVKYQLPYRHTDSRK